LPSFSDDEFCGILALKGGNAVVLIYDAAQRASIDLDFSIESDFPTTNLQALGDRFEQLLNTTLSPEGFRVFDVSFTASAGDDLHQSADVTIRARERVRHATRQPWY